MGCSLKTIPTITYEAYPWAAARTCCQTRYTSNNQYGGTIGGPIKKDKVVLFLELRGYWLLIATSPFLARRSPLR